MDFFYLEVLKREFERRRERNPRYSIRAFSRDLGVDHGTIAGVLSGRRAPSRNLSERLVQVLELDLEEKKAFLASATERRHRLAIEKGRVRHAGALSGQYEFKGQVIPARVYSLFSEWYSTAILELTFVEGFQSDPRWISGRLGIPADLVEKKISELTAAGYLTKDDSGRLIKTAPVLGTAERDRTCDDLRARQREVLDHAIKSLDQVPIDQRSQIAMTMAIDPEKVPIARQLISEFLESLCVLLESGRRRQVYECSVSLFPWDRVQDLDKNTL